MSGSNWKTHLATLLFVGAALFALDRYWAYASARDEFTTTEKDLIVAQDMLKRHAQAFVDKPADAPNVSLKAVVQQLGRKHRMNLVYLTEVEKEAGKGVRERNVITRVSKVAHGDLARFLSDVESKGSGIRIKEIQLKPSKTESGVYATAECVVVKRVASGG